MPINKITAYVLMAGALASAGKSRAEDAPIEREPLHIGTSIDVGQIVRGKLDQERLDMQMIQRTGVMLTQAVTVRERLTVRVGVGGLFWYSLPEDQTLPHRRTTKFGPGVGEAQGLLAVGDAEKPWMRLQFGLFPYKYNPDSRNLGEYLLRSGTYPGYLVTGGWNIIGSSAYMALGLRAHMSHLDGLIQQDFLLPMERDVEPNGDFSPAYIATVNQDGAFTVGAGIQLAHYLTFQSGRLAPDGPTFDQGPLNRFKGDSVVLDTATTGYENFTFKGIKLMGRASFNPQAILESDWLGPQDLKIYAEAAVLGVKDYAYYYDDILSRIPVMVGINLPTFKLLDALSVEAEYRRTDFPNSIAWSFESSLPTWYLEPDPSIKAKFDRDNPTGPDDIPKTPGYADIIKYYDKTTYRREGIKWSVYARKALATGLHLHAQAASDHMRGITFNPYPDRRPLTRTPGDWYYLLRLEFGI